MQKRANNFYSKNDRNNMILRHNTEENNFGDKYSQFNLTESKNFNRNNINSPINEKKNFLVNTDLRTQNRQDIFESGQKTIYNTYYYKNSQSNNKNIQNNIIKERNNSDLNNKYNTDYDNENDGLYYQEIQSKIYKKVIQQIYNNLYKYCRKYILKDGSEFLKNLKEISSKNQPKQKTYRKKNIVNKNIYKFKKTPNKFSQSKNYEEKFTSPSNNYKIFKKKRNKFISQNTSINNSNTKNNIVYSNYYNMNIYENNTTNKYVYSSKKNQTKFLKDYSNYTLPEKNICVNSLNGNRNNMPYNYATRKNLVKTCIRKNPNINYTQPKNYTNLNKEIKTNLKIDNKNSLEYINNITKKKIIDKLQNIKLFKQKNDYQTLDKKVYTKEDSEKKKEHFHNLMSKLRIISFYKHIEKFVFQLNNNIKKEFLKNLKFKANNDELKNENKEQEIINTQNNNNLNEQNENYNNLNKEDIPNKIEFDIDNKKDNLDEIKDLKNIEINYETIDKKVKEDNIDNNIQNINSKNLENSEKENKTDKEMEENNINGGNNLDMNSIENNNNDDNIINENKNIEESDNEKDDNNININSQSKDDNIEKVASNENEHDTSGNNEKYLDDQINNEKNEELNIDSNIENFKENEQREKELIKDNEINIDINKEDQTKFNEAERNNCLQQLFNNISIKEKNNTLKKYFYKWSEIIFDINSKGENNINENEENELVNKSEENKDEIIHENEIENKNDKRNILKMKNLFLDEVDDEEKCVIMEEMVFRFRTLLMLSCFKNEEYLSDSFE